MVKHQKIKTIVSKTIAQDEVWRTIENLLNRGAWGQADVVEWIQGSNFRAVMGYFRAIVFICHRKSSQICCEFAEMSFG